VKVVQSSDELRLRKGREFGPHLSPRYSRLVTLVASLLGAVVPMDAQGLPATCAIPAAWRNASASHVTARDYSSLGLQFSRQPNLTCAVAAFGKALSLEPGSPERRRQLSEARNSVGLPRAQGANHERRRICFGRQKRLIPPILNRIAT
jgi:hypothetical protein